MNKYEAYDFDDLLLTPQPTSSVNSRKSVDLLTQNDMIKFDHVPICAANMEGVGTFEMALALSKFKWLTFIHKHYTLDEWEQFYSRYSSQYTRYVIPTFGTNDKCMTNAYEFCNKFKERAHTVCFDVANGHTQASIRAVKGFRDLLFPDIKIIYGNAANPEILEEVGAYIDAVKVGIGSGSVCSTRTKTGVGVPQASLIKDFKDYIDKHTRVGEVPIKIISDGGCRTPGDVTKAFFLGADMVMLGGMLSGHTEGGDQEFFYGSSSRASRCFEDKDYLTDEGIIVKNKKNGPVRLTVQDIEGGLRSACTYMNVKHLRNLIEESDKRDYLYGGHFRIVRKQVNNY